MNTAHKIYQTNTDTYLKIIQNHIYYRDEQSLYQFLADPALKSSMTADEWADFINMPINNDGDTLLIWACYRGYNDLALFLMNEPATSLLKPDFHGFNALTVAQHAKRNELVQALNTALEQRQESSPPTPFHFEEPLNVVATPQSKIREWLYGGKQASNENVTTQLVAKRAK